MLHYREEESVIGQPFYMMEHDERRLMRDTRLIEAEPAERRALSLELMRVLARLHQADYRALGLEGFGRPEGPTYRTGGISLSSRFSAAPRSARACTSALTTARRRVPRRSRPVFAIAEPPQPPGGWHWQRTEP